MIKQKFHFFPLIDYIRKKVYNQNNILRLINDSVILNNDSYDELTKILDSNDDHNIKLAMELIANCDYEKSAVYILLLFKYYLWI